MAANSSKLVAAVNALTFEIMLISRLHCSYTPSSGTHLGGLDLAHVRHKASRLHRPDARRCGLDSVRREGAGGPTSTRGSSRSSAGRTLCQNFRRRRRGGRGQGHGRTDRCRCRGGRCKPLSLGTWVHFRGSSRCPLSCNSGQCPRIRCGLLSSSSCSRPCTDSTGHTHGCGRLWFCRRCCFCLHLCHTLLLRFGSSVGRRVLLAVCDRSHGWRGIGHNDSWRRFRGWIHSRSWRLRRGRGRTRLSCRCPCGIPWARICVGKGRRHLPNGHSTGCSCSCSTGCSLG